MFSEGVGIAREKENQNIAQEMSWRTRVTGLNVPVVEQSAL